MSIRNVAAFHEEGQNNKAAALSYQQQAKIYTTLIRSIKHHALQCAAKAENLKIKLKKFRKQYPETVAFSELGEHLSGIFEGDDPDLRIKRSWLHDITKAKKHSKHVTYQRRQKCNSLLTCFTQELTCSF